MDTEMNLFDIVGPVMIGPSSSHTAGAARIGLTARLLLGEEVVRAEIGLHGSFAKTYRGHGTDRALVGGLMGMQVDDPRLRLCLDVGHANAELSHTPVMEWVEACGPYLRHLHLHNNAGGWDLHDPLERGTVPMEAVLVEAPARKFTLAVV